MGKGKGIADEFGVETAGFVREIRGVADGNGWDHIYDISYYYGFFATLISYAALYHLFPVPRQRGSSPFVLDMHAETLDGVGPAAAGEGEHMQKVDDDDGGGDDVVAEEKKEKTAAVAARAVAV